MQILNKLRFLSLGLATFAMVGCASFYDKQVVASAKYVMPQKIDESYTIDGRFSIKNTTKNYYGNFSWVHNTDYDKLSLNSPLGNSVAVISVESNIATLQTTEASYSGTDLDKLLINNLGFTLPLIYLHYWVQGIPLPDYPVDANLDSGFEQLGWQVEYLQWYDSNHPEIVRVSNDKLYIKLLILNWN